MAIVCVKRGDEFHDPNYKEFVITDESDVANLPTGLTDPSAAPGSQAYTQDMEHTYLLGTDNVWREV